MLVRWAARRHAADDRVEQAAGTAGAVGQFGREGGVAAGDSAFAQQSRAEPGWRRRLAPRPPAGRRTPRDGPGRAACGAACGASSRRRLRSRRGGRRAPTPPASIGFLPGGWTLAEQHRLRRRPDPDTAAVAPELRPAASGFGAASSTVTGPSLIRRSPTMVHAPGFGVTARIRRSTTWAGRSHRTRASSTVTFGATVTPSAGCGTARQRAVGDAVERRLQQRRTRNRQPVKQIPRGVGRPDRLGDDAVDRARSPGRVRSGTWSRR